MTKRRLTTLAAVLALAGLLGACGGSEDSNDASGGGSGGGSGDGAASDQEAQDAMLEYAECMREQGVEMDDPDVSGEGGLVFGPEPGASQADQEEFAAADAVCGEILAEVAEDAPQIDPEQQAELQDQLVAVSECMREKGHDMPDPEVNSQGQVMIGIGEGVEPGAADFEQFQADMRECQDEIGMAGPGSGAGPGGLGGGG
jgi:hypothetical protein